MSKYLVPNLWFKDCCDDHDMCFDTCTKTYEQCNAAFLPCNASKCNFRDHNSILSAITGAIFPVMPLVTTLTCLGLAEFYHSAVVKESCPAYLDSGADRCGCR